MTFRSTRHLVDPELAGMLEVWPTVALTPELLALMRSSESRLPLPPLSEAAQSVEVTRHVVPGPDGDPDISLLVCRPQGQGPFPALYHIHGGGYVAGSAEEVESIQRERAADLGCVVVSVNYRLAPDTRFPGPVEDCYAGLAWTFDSAAELGIDPARIGVIGESAGGGLAAALALLARDRGEYALAFQHLIYPMLDDRTCDHHDPNPVAGEFIWTPHNNAFGWSALLGHEPGRAGVSPYAAAARAVDLSDLPPAYVTTGALDLFVDENIDYARRLNRAGVPTELHVYPGGFHGYDLHATADVSARARRDSRDALHRALFPKA